MNALLFPQRLHKHALYKVYSAWESSIDGSLASQCKSSASDRNHRGKEQPQP